MVLFHGEWTNPDRYAECDSTNANKGFDKIIETLVSEGLIDHWSLQKFT